MPSLPRFLQLFLLATLVLLVPSALYLSRPAHSGPLSDAQLASVAPQRQSQGQGPEPLPPLPILADALRLGEGEGAIMGKMGNETAKAELGRATWRFLHTMTLRFPESPSPNERAALLDFMHLFSRLYPCGECAAHFQQLLKEMPPQTSSRKAASLWLCEAHNRVNARLGKAMFPCDKLDATYDCGCGDASSSSSDNSTSGAEQPASTAVEIHTDAPSQTPEAPYVPHRKPQ